MQVQNHLDPVWPTDFPFTFLSLANQCAGISDIASIERDLMAHVVARLVIDLDTVSKHTAGLLFYTEIPGLAELAYQQADSAHLLRVRDNHPLYLSLFPSPFIFSLPSISQSPLRLPSITLSFPSVPPLTVQLKGLGEHCKLPSGSGWSPTAKCFSCISCHFNVKLANIQQIYVYQVPINTESMDFQVSYCLIRLYCSNKYGILGDHTPLPPLKSAFALTDWISCTTRLLDTFVSCEHGERRRSSMHHIATEATSNARNELSYRHIYSHTACRRQRIQIIISERQSCCRSPYEYFIQAYDLQPPKICS